MLHHYDLSRRFYDMFLDKHRFYTMACFCDPEAVPQTSLELAQKDKAALNRREWQRDKWHAGSGPIVSAAAVS